MSEDFQLITRHRPDAWAFARTISEAAGRELDIAGDFADPDDYLNISAANGLWIEVEPPGHVDHDDLVKIYAEESVPLPAPDPEGCLWLTTATVPAGAPSASANVIHQTFRRLAQSHDGITLPPE